MRFLVFSVLVWLIMKADTTNGKRHREIAALFGILCTSILFSILSVPSIRDDLETIHRLASLDCSSPPTECVFAFAETDWTDRGARRRLSTGTSCSTTNWTPIYVVQSSQLTPQRLKYFLIHLVKLTWHLKELIHILYEAFVILRVQPKNSKLLARTAASYIVA